MLYNLPKYSIKAIILLTFLLLNSCADIANKQDTVPATDNLLVESSPHAENDNKNAGKNNIVINNSHPSFKIGDYFSFNNPDITWQVTAVDGENVEWENNNGDSQITSKNPLLPALEWKSKKRGEGRRIISDIKGKFFPLRVGNQIFFKTTVNTSKPPYVWEFDWACDFTSKEKISVPAGIFDTYRVDCYRQKPEKWSFYYAPSIGYYVKMESNNNVNPNDIRTRELVEFSHSTINNRTIPAIAEDVDNIVNAIYKQKIETIDFSPTSQISQKSNPQISKTKKIIVSAALPTSYSYGAHIESFRNALNIDKAWQQITAKYPNYLANFEKSVRRVDLGKKGIFNRLIIGKFKSKAAVVKFCKKLKQIGQSYCMPMIL